MKETTTVVEQEQELDGLATDSELRKRGMNYCQIIGVKPNAGKEDGEGKSFVLKVSIPFDPEEDGHILEILPKKVIKAVTAEEIPFHPKMPFKFSGGQMVKLGLFKNLEARPFFNQSVILHQGAELKVITDDLHLIVKMTIALEDVDTKLPYWLIEIFADTIYTRIYKEQSELDLNE